MAAPISYTLYGNAEGVDIVEVQFSPESSYYSARNMCELRTQKSRNISAASP